MRDMQANANPTKEGGNLVELQHFNMTNTN
jgi:hypothetical protein